ncbi:MAG TPA: PadR family transcriptional regulator [Rugosimonospora sp.]|nr:PadR family transcriptional regulator [Rugosimonospora sp.]
MSQLRVRSLLAPAVLAALQIEPAHPYMIAARLRAHGGHQPGRVKIGSLYAVVRSLHRHGLIRAVHTERQDNRPRRTVYEITERGRVELRDRINELVQVSEYELPAFPAVLATLVVLGPGEVSGLLRRRRDALQTHLVAARTALASARNQVPWLLLAAREYDLALRASEVDWLDTVLRRLTRGRPALPPAPAGLEGAA